MLIVGVVLWMAFIEVEKPKVVDKKGALNGNQPGEDDSRVREEPDSRGSI